jgi:hypothetical protein
MQSTPPKQGVSQKAGNPKLVGTKFDQKRIATMKRKKLGMLRNVAITAVGLVLARGAQADTTLTFDVLLGGQSSNARILDGFGSQVTGSSSGVTVSGADTSHIGLLWGFTAIAGGGGGGGNNIEWDYYIGGPWQGTQLNNSAIGNEHTLTFAPTGGYAVTLNSFNFHPYYNNGSAEHFDYTISIMDGATTLASQTISFDSDAQKDHPVVFDYTGAAGETLSLSVLRTGGNGNAFDIAADDFKFGELAPVPEPGTLALLSAGAIGLGLTRRRRRLRQSRKK